MGLSLGTLGTDVADFGNAVICVMTTRDTNMTQSLGTL